MGLIAVVLASAALAADPAPEARLAAMRRSMESYLSRIRTIRLEYEETWQEAAVEDPLLRAYRETLKRIRIGADHAPAPPVDSDPRRSVAKETAIYDLLDAFPSIRLSIRFRKTFLDGSVEEHRVRKYVHDGVYKEVDDEHKITYQLGDVTKGFPRSPLNVLGRRLYQSLNRPLSAMLELPSITVMEGTEALRGLETVVIRVGPVIPASHRVAGTTGNEWLRLWLAPARSHLAVRAEFYIPRSRNHPPTASGVATAKDYYIHRAEMDDFQPAWDEARNENILFPRLITYTDPAGTMTWRVKGVVINVPSSARDFDPRTPDGYLVSRDGAVPSVKLAGGRAAQARAVADSVRAARQALGRDAPRAAEDGNPLFVRVLVPIGFAGVVTILLVLRRRLGHAS